MITATITDAGMLVMSDAAERAGFRPGAVVQVSVTSAGSLLVVLDDRPPRDVDFRPLVGGAAQLAGRRAGEAPR